MLRPTSSPSHIQPQSLLFTNSISHLDHIRAAETEFGAVAGRVAPASRAALREARAHTDDRFDVELLGRGQHEVDLVQLLNDDDGARAELLREQRSLD